MKPLKIAIFSGEIPSTTFIEHVIEGVAHKHDVLLFGVVSKRKQYGLKRIKIYNTPKSHIQNLGITVFRMLLLLVSKPKDLYLLVKEIKTHSSFYNQWIWFSKSLPIVLYKPDVFHIQWAQNIEFYWFLKDIFNVKFVVSLLGSHINYTPIVQPKIADTYRTTFPRVDAFHAVSNTIAKEAQFYNAPLDKITLIHSPIQASTFTQFQTVKRMKSSGLKLISVGRHHWVKGYKYAISSMFILKSMGVDCSYTIIAQGELPEELVFMRSQLDLVDEITFLSGVPQNLLFEKMKTYDMLLLPSLNEGIANVVLEAMALGIPVISSDCGGMSEVIMPNETGWLVPVRDVNAMAKTIVEISETSEQDLQRITKNAHEFVKQHFNAEDSIQQFLTLYSNVYNG
jgi:colanic acid/amylovoran biosynthesis glycosyltransferase